MSISASAVRLIRDLLIHQGDAPIDRVDDARAAYDRALELVHSDAERRFLERRLAELP